MKFVTPFQYAEEYSRIAFVSRCTGRFLLDTDMILLHCNNCSTSLYCNNCSTNCSILVLLLSSTAAAILLLRVQSIAVLFNRQHAFLEFNHATLRKSATALQGLSHVVQTQLGLHIRNVMP